jgi:hypothetical protein
MTEGKQAGEGYHVPLAGHITREKTPRNPLVFVRFWGELFEVHQGHFVILGFEESDLEIVVLAEL